MCKVFNLIDCIRDNRDKSIIIWICNIGAEKYWNKVSSGFVDTNEDAIVNRLEEMNLLVCRSQDIMILREKPDIEYLKILKQRGFSIPRILTPENADLLTPISELVLKDKKLINELKKIGQSEENVYFVPYAVTYLEEQIAKECSLTIIGSQSKISAKVNDKAFNRRIAEELGLPVCKGKVCNSIEEIRNEYQTLTRNAPYFKKVVIKEPYGASGKGLYIIDSDKKLEACLLKFTRLQKNKLDCVWLVEGWYNKKSDLNCQMFISSRGAINIFSIKQQILRDTVYIGSILPPNLEDYELTLYKNYCKRIGEYLYNIGYIGVVGIDSIITDEGTIIPIIEINGRFTLSTYISFIQQKFGASRMLSCYMKLVTDRPLDYKMICDMLLSNDMLLGPGSNEGILLYTSATLPLIYVKSDNVYYGRLFALILSDNQEYIDEQYQKFSELIQKISRVF